MQKVPLLSGDPSEPTRQTFYRHLVNNLSFWDLLPFLGTVGANLTQNCFFLIENSGAACDGHGACSMALSITACVIDIAASGTQNTFQRFWKSLTWAWVARLPRPTATFIRALRNFLQNNGEEKDALMIYIGDNIQREISGTPLWNISLQLVSAHEKNLPIYFSTEALENAIERAHFLVYNPKNEPLTLPQDKILIQLTTNYNIEDALKLIFLGFMPWIMFIFQTISMLSKITGTRLPLAIFSCLFGAFCGHEKYKVNNTLRRKIANDHWEDLKTRSFYQDSAIYLGSTFFYLANGFSLLLFSASKTEGLKHIGASSLRLFGIFIGVNIALFYLYIGLFTKAGIQFTLKTGMRVFQTDDQTVLNGYIHSHMYVDIICAISSLFFNGVLTQTRESIKKCDDIAIKFEQWMDNNTTGANDDKKNSTPWWVHLANVIDIFVFALSARAAIAGLLQLPILDQKFDVLLKNYYPEIAGAGAGISNLIFTYVSAAPNQKEAWGLLIERLTRHTITPPHSLGDEESIGTYVDSLVDSLPSSAPATPRRDETGNQTLDPHSSSWCNLFTDVTSLCNSFSPKNQARI